MPGPSGERHFDLASGDHTEAAVDGHLRSNPSVRRSECPSLVSYEVVRHKLRDLIALQREVMAHRFNPPPCTVAYCSSATLHTGGGVPVFFDAERLFLGALGDAAIRDAVERVADPLEFEHGDLFIRDEPSGVPGEAVSTSVYAPLLLDGELLAWVANTVNYRELHSADTAGRSVRTEMLHLPARNIVAGGNLREDELRNWVGRFRLSEIGERLLRSQIESTALAQRRLGGIVDEHGGAVVSSVMDEVVFDTAATLTARLGTLPDGEWTESRYVMSNRTGKGELSRIAMRMTKVGTSLKVDVDGEEGRNELACLSDDVFRACVADAVLSMLAWDQDGGGANFVGQIEISRLGKTRPSTSVSPAANRWHEIDLFRSMAQRLGAKMLSASGLTRDHIFAPVSIRQELSTDSADTEIHGSTFGDFLLDTTSAATSASPLGDGISAGESSTALLHPSHTVEDVESALGLICLYRQKKSLPGGHGQWRGGDSLESVWLVPGTLDLTVEGPLSGEAASEPALGLFGAFPVLGERLPRMSCGDRQNPEPGIVLMSGDRLHVLGPHGSSFGDPLLRAPDAVAKDVADSRVSAHAALEIYGVVLSRGEVDSEATVAHRRAERAQRIRSSRPPRRPAPGSLEDKARGALWTVLVGGKGEDGVLACAYCRRILSRSRKGYRWGCAELEMPMARVATFARDDHNCGEWQSLCLRQYLCPQCATVLDSEICKPDDEPTDDVGIAE